MQQPTPTTSDLVSRVLAGEAQAWQMLQTRIAPSIERWVQGHAQMRKRNLCGADSDHVRNVLVAALERLARNEFRNLHNYVEATRQRPEASFESWLYVLVEYTVMGYLRDLYGRSPLKGGGEPREAGRAGPSRRDVNSQAGRLDVEDECLERISGITTKLTAQQILDRVQAVFSEREFACLHAYIALGLSYDEMAEALQMESAKQAQDLVRALKERLRVMFRES